MGDEGLILAGAERILSGKIPFRDFFSLVPPGIYYLLAITWAIFGKYYLVTSLLTIFIAWFICIFIYLNSRLILNKTWSMLATFLFAVLLHTSHNILSFHWLATLMVLISVWQLNKYIVIPKTKYLITSGISLGLGAFFLHTKPVLVIIIMALWILWQEKKQSAWQLAFKKAGIFCLSVGLTFFILIIPFVLKSGLATVWQNLIISNLYYYPKLGYIKLTKNFLFYLFIVNQLFLLLLIFIKNKPRQISLYLAISLGLFLSCLYRFDLIHLAYIYPTFSLILIFYLIDKINTPYKYFPKIIITIFLIIQYILLYFPWIDIYTQKKSWYPVSTDIGQVYFGPVPSTIVKSVMETLKDIPEKEIFIYPYAAYYYNFASKENPTRYDIVFEDYLSEEAKYEIVNDLQTKNIKHIVYLPATNPNHEQQTKIIHDYIAKNYTEQKINYGNFEAYFYLYTKK